MAITRLNPSHPYTDVVKDNVANARTLIFAWQAPNNTQLRIGDPEAQPDARLQPGEFFPVLNLVDSGGAQIPGESLLVLVARADKSERRTELGHIRYHAFRDLSTAQQRDKDYRGSVLAQLQGRVRINESNHLEVYLESTAVADVSHTATTFELPVVEARL